VRRLEHDEEQAAEVVSHSGPAFPGRSGSHSRARL
jgi:hypothetical protein